MLLLLTPMLCAYSRLGPLMVAVVVACTNCGDIRSIVTNILEAHKHDWTLHAINDGVIF